ncbi:MAG: L,D-transpeptidase family protein [Myxococcota bacterium]
MRRAVFLLCVAATAAAAWEAATRVPTGVFLAPDAGAPWATLAAGTRLELDEVLDGGWARLDAGYVRTASLRALDAGEAPAPQPAFVWGSAKSDAGVTVRARPAEDAAVTGLEPEGRTLAFLERPPRPGWLERPAGGFVAAAEVVLHRQVSTLRGEPAPTLPLAFVFRATTRSLPDGGAEPVAKFARFPLVALDGGSVEIDGGTLPRRDVRIVAARPAPPELDGGAWIDVDLTEQTLVAWDGARPVFATLVSAGTGAPQRTTPTGVFRVWLKARHERMHGDDYFVEEVPFIQYFRRGAAIHGVTWHDRFGQRMSHGCVNLSLADAAWLFDWSPPPMPAGWHDVYVERRPGTPTLLVRIE